MRERPRVPVRAPTPGERSDAATTPLTGLPAAFLTQLIIGAAMNEGAAFFALVAYLIEKNPIALGLAVVLIAGVITRFPTAGRVETLDRAAAGKTPRRSA